MKTKLLLSVTLIFIFSKVYSQISNCPEKVDSLMSIINASLSKYRLKLDSGAIKMPFPDSVIGSYKRTVWVDKTSGATMLEKNRQAFNSGDVRYDYYYFWNYKVIFFERINISKKIFDRHFYVCEGGILEKKENGIIPCDSTVQLVGNRILIKSKL